MNIVLRQNLAWLAQQPALLSNMRRGLEKESLRIDAAGHLAQTPHAAELGSALTHPWITTDYSEALIELITPPTKSISETLGFLDNIHRFVYANIGQEALWVNSMPCILGDDDTIPLAQYGQSNIGKMKTLYRHGLGVRYGRRMQTIAGIHYNLSFPSEFFAQWQEQEKSAQSVLDFRAEKYFGLVRNFQRQSWLILFLMGASPAVCGSFLQNRQHQLQKMGKGTLFLPKATSLRMSSLGYQNSAQSELKVSYNHLQEYVHDLDAAIRTPLPLFEKIGLKDAQGNYQQINTHVLQIENEYYGLIRPKQTIQRGERPTVALQRRGVEYVELRCVDLNPFNPIGIDEVSAYFLEVFALHCLLRSAPQFEDYEYSCLPKNQQEVVERGRDPELALRFCGRSDSLLKLAHELLEELAEVAPILDSAHNTLEYSQSIKAQQEKLLNPELTYSAQILKALPDFDNSFFQFAKHHAEKTRDYFLSRPLSAEMMQDFEQQAKKSHLDQEKIEREDNRSFDDFLMDYFK